MIHCILLTLCSLALGKNLTLPELDYNFDALQPFIDEETMRLHYTKHFQGYADKYNSAVTQLTEVCKKGETLADENIAQLVQKLDEIEDKELRTLIRNNGGGYLNHVLFFRTLQPANGQKVPQPQGDVLTAIKSNFKSFTDFQVTFKQAALSVFGSGWAWLVLEKKSPTDKCNLEIVTTSNQDNPIMFEQEDVYETIPILGLDVWEHSYYLNYQNRRADYVDAWWHVINWEVVNEHFSTCSNKELDVETFFQNNIEATSAEGWRKLTHRSQQREQQTRGFKALHNPEDYFIIS